MWMSNVLVVVNSRNVDRNSLNEIVAAVSDLGARVIDVDSQAHVIEASLPSQDVSTIKAMEGVTYVRVVFSYFCPDIDQLKAA